MVISSCLANFCSFGLIMAAAALGLNIAVRVQDLLKDREMTTFPFKKILIVTCLSPLLLVLCLISLNLAGSQSKLVNLAFSEIQIEKCETKSAKLDEGDNDDSEEIALFCGEEKYENIVNIPGKYFKTSWKSVNSSSSEGNV